MKKPMRGLGSRLAKKPALDDFVATRLGLTPEELAAHARLQERALEKLRGREQLPSVGRIVHYYPRKPTESERDRPDDAGPYAAVIVDVLGGGQLSVAWFDRLGDCRRAIGIRHDEKRGAGTWSWPPRV